MSCARPVLPPSTAVQCPVLKGDISMDLQRSSSNWVLSGLLIAFSLVLGAATYWQEYRASPVPYVSRQMTLAEAAQSNDIPVKAFIHELSHTDPDVWNLPRHVTIKYLRISDQSLQQALDRVMQERTPIVDMMKYVIMALWVSTALLLILVRKQLGTVRLTVMALTVLVFGVIMGASPNPMTALVKFFKMLNRQQDREITVAVSLIVFTAFSLLGGKLLCGWACPLGSLQELVYSTPFLKRRRAFKLPFALSLAARLVLFVSFVLLLFGAGLRLRNVVLYQYVDYFRLFRFGALARFALYTLPVLLLLSFFIFRPFCQLVCPFGLYAWLLENLAVNKPRIIEERCTHCEKCVAACPTGAMRETYRKRRYFLPDCWSCGACIESCPDDAVVYAADQWVDAMQRSQSDGRAAEDAVS